MIRTTEGGRLSSQSLVLPWSSCLGLVARLSTPAGIFLEKVSSYCIRETETTVNAASALESPCQRKGGGAGLLLLASWFWIRCRRSSGFSFRKISDDGSLSL